MRRIPGRAILKYKIHWHVFFTHFPVSFFALSFGFMIFHLATGGACYELASYLSLVAGAFLLVASTISGWLTWKGRYKGFPGKVFSRKIRISYAMLVVVAAVLTWRAVFPYSLHAAWPWLYLAAIGFLLAGALAEGFYGGRLNHR